MLPGLKTWLCIFLGFSLFLQIQHKLRFMAGCHIETSIIKKGYVYLRSNGHVCPFYRLLHLLTLQLADFISQGDPGPSGRPGKPGSQGSPVSSKNGIHLSSGERTGKQN